MKQMLFGTVSHLVLSTLVVIGLSNSAMAQVAADVATTPQAQAVTKQTIAPKTYGNPTWDAKTRQLEWNSLSAAQQKAWIVDYNKKVTAATAAKAAEARLATAPATYGKPEWDAKTRQLEWNSLTTTQKTAWVADYNKKVAAANTAKTAEARLATAPTNYGNPTWDAKTRQLEWNSLTPTQKNAWFADQPKKTATATTRNTAKPSQTTAPATYGKPEWDATTRQLEWNSLTATEKNAWLADYTKKTAATTTYPSNAITVAPANYGKPEWDAKTRQLEWNSLSGTEKDAWLAKATGASTVSPVKTGSSYSGGKGNEDLTEALKNLNLDGKGTNTPTPGTTASIIGSSTNLTVVPTGFGSSNWTDKTRQLEWNSLSTQEKEAWLADQSNKLAATSNQPRILPNGYNEAEWQILTLSEREDLLKTYPVSTDATYNQQLVTTRTTPLPHGFNEMEWNRLSKQERIQWVNNPAP